MVKGFITDIGIREQACILHTDKMKQSYDGLHRLKDAVYKEGSSVNNHYTEKVTGYDRNGNITALQRYGRTGSSSWGVVDNLTLTRTGNQLTSVSDSGRGISSVTWNEIDLPQTVTFSNGSTINYYYSADGTKLREVRTVSGTATTIDWCGDLVLEKVGNGTRAAKRLRLDGGGPEPFQYRGDSAEIETVQKTEIHVSKTVSQFIASPGAGAGPDGLCSGHSSFLTVFRQFFHHYPL